MSAEALADARRKVGASVRALDQLVPTAGASSSANAAGAVPVPPDGLADMFLTLLGQVKSTTTMLAMAFKPPLTAAAVSPQAAKLEDQVGRLVSCVLAAAGSGGDGRSALLDEWREGVSLVGERIEGLFSVLETAARDGVAAPREGEQSPYLAHTGLVWSAVDILADTLPRTESDAVARRWGSQKATAKDAWDEFKEMLDADSDVENDEDDDFGMDDDDEWGILEAPMGKLDKAERARAMAAKPILALHQLFHAALPRYVPVLALSPEESYAPLLDAGAALVAGLDDAVAALHPGQDAGEVKAEIEALNRLGRTLAKTFSDRLARAPADENKRADAASFVQRWEARLADETAKWDQARMSLAELEDALP